MDSISFDMSEIVAKDEIEENRDSSIVEFKERTSNNVICDTTFFSVEIPSKKRGKKAKKQNEKEIMKNYFDEIAMKSSKIMKEPVNDGYILDDCTAYYIDANSDQSDSHKNSDTNSYIGTNTNNYTGTNTNNHIENGNIQKGSKRGSSTKTSAGKKRGGADGTKNERIAGANREGDDRVVFRNGMKENENTGGKGIPNAIEKKMMKPKNASQEQYVNHLNHHDKKIIFAIGPAGTGKTMFATQYAIKHFLLGNYDKIIFTRPTVSVDEDIGFLPGSIEEKLSPWLRPIFDILYEFITVKEVQTLLEEKVFEMAPIGYLRGRTFKRSFIIADEMQNCTKNQMKMLLTRLGEQSRMVVTGDLEQHDRTGETNGLADFLSKLRKKRSESIELVEFERNDILREPIIKEVLEIYSL
jgi:phosphate starvation-inducible PhoH-like protein